MSLVQKIFIKVNSFNQVSIKLENHTIIPINIYEHDTEKNYIYCVFVNFIPNDIITFIIDGESVEYQFESNYSTEINLQLEWNEEMCDMILKKV